VVHDGRRSRVLPDNVAAAEARQSCGPAPAGGRCASARGAARRARGRDSGGRRGTAGSDREGGGPEATKRTRSEVSVPRPVSNVSNLVGDAAVVLFTVVYDDPEAWATSALDSVQHVP
jgi:hypothetical protein